MENSEQDNRSKKSAKMKLYQITQKNFASFGVHPNLSHQQYPLNTKIFKNFLILISHIICSLVFEFYEAKTFFEYTQSIYMCSLAVLIILALVIIIFNVEKLFKLINDCENLANATLKCSKSKSIFNETKQLEEKISSFLFFVMIKFTPIGIIVPWMTYIFFVYFTTDAGNAAFELPCPIWFPFEWKNPVGFLFAGALQYTMYSCAITIGACVIDLGIGLYLYAIAMSKCIKQNLFAISQSTRSKADTERKLIWEQFIEYIEFDASAKRWLNDVSDIYQHFFTILFLWSLITICGALIMIQIQLMHHGDNLAVLLIIAFQVFYAFGVMFTGCELCQRVNLAFDECNDMIDQFKWYLLPAEIQRRLSSIVHFAQQPVEINCFGSWPCNRETFKYLIKNAYSYFTVLREFY